MQWVLNEDWGQMARVSLQVFHYGRIIYTLVPFVPMSRESAHGDYKQPDLSQLYINQKILKAKFILSFYVHAD